MEYGVIVAHVRLLSELKERADRLREDRYGSTPQPQSEAGTQPVASGEDSPVPLT